MALSSLATALAAILVLILSKYLIYPIWFSPHAKIPTAHPLAAVSRLWLNHQRSKGRTIKSVYAAHKKQGPIVRLTPNEVSVASLEGLRKIYLGGFEKDPWYLEEFTNFGTTNLVSMLDHRSHSNQKRMISREYSNSFIQTSGNLAHLSAAIMYDRFLPVLDAASKDTDGINVMELVQWAAMDMTTAYIFGSKNGTNFLQDRESRTSYFENFLCTRNMTEDIKERIENKCMALSKAALDDMLDSDGGDNLKTSHPVVFSKLYESLLEAGAKDPLKEAASEVLDHLIASQETIAITLTYAVYWLSRSPDLQAKLHAELLSLSPAISAQSAPVLPAPSAIDRLPFLNAVINETLRLHAPVSARLPRVVPRGGVELHGYNVPAGWTVSSNAYTLHRNQEVYPDPEEWAPSRWLPDTNSGEALKAMRRWFWPFGSGGRMCIGSHFALQRKYYPISNSSFHLLTGRTSIETDACGHLHELLHDCFGYDWDGAVGFIHIWTSRKSADGDIHPY